MDSSDVGLPYWKSLMVSSFGSSDKWFWMAFYMVFSLVPRNFSLPNGCSHGPSDGSSDGLFLRFLRRFLPTVYQIVYVSSDGLFRRCLIRSLPMVPQMVSSDGSSDGLFRWFLRSLFRWFLRRSLSMVPRNVSLLNGFLDGLFWRVSQKVSSDGLSDWIRFLRWSLPMASQKSLPLVPQMVSSDGFLRRFLPTGYKIESGSSDGLFWRFLRRFLPTVYQIESCFSDGLFLRFLRMFLPTVY